MKRQGGPEIFVNEIQDPVIRKNFQNLLDYFERDGNFNDFKFIEFEAKKAEANIKINHNLGYIPKDIVISSQEGSGSLTFNRDKFDKQFLDVTTTGDVKARLYVGTQGV